MLNSIIFDQYEIEVISFNTIVVGSGAAGYNAANRLYTYGQKDLALITENRNAGTSRNTGSDKQTYYKLTLSGEETDSVREMAKTLFEGKAVDGPVAMAEASASAQCFLNLVELGVPFPSNRYGEFVGYKTDHDPRKRGTSVGPLTSKKMTEMLEKAVDARDIPIYDRHLVISILTEDGIFKGVLALDTTEKDIHKAFRIFAAKNVIYATGGPSNMYKDSVYPHGHYGMSGIAFESGVLGRNLTEWQYGLASVRPRWNVSGTYMQVMPRFISTDQKGEEEREFLFDFFKEKSDALDHVFLKGYQWPFDVRKMEGGSSIIDILVYIETKLKKRRVFLDFRENPLKEEIDFDTLSRETREYLEQAHATTGTPLDRLLIMNAPAYEFYKGRGVDLKEAPLEIALCAQHNNGGLAVDEWWRTNVTGFFAAGEVAGSHGVYRPGGSALNAGQVGSMRAAQYISRHRTGSLEDLTEDYFRNSLETIRNKVLLSAAALSDESNVMQLLENAQSSMSEIGASIRDVQKIEAYLGHLEARLKGFGTEVRIRNISQFSNLYRLYDVYLAQYVYLHAMTDYQKTGGKSRGSAMYHDAEGMKVFEDMDETFRFVLDDHGLDEMIQEIELGKVGTKTIWRKREPLPLEEDFFENVWKTYRENENIY